ncbi:hypothetical protein [Amycolatopsis sp.]|uniref:hypothetical protein n=1 Tax=Amycolatopsis sp. TaxID=37632 RepID=UPI002E067D6E|nr:hypothetical protein [Amycolatopsis sp.]
MSAQRALRRLSVVLVLVFTFATPLPATAAPTWKAGACTSAEGVTVAADLTGAGRPEVVVRCVSGDPGTARTALDRAGLTIHTSEQAGVYEERDHVCRVENLPATADACAGHQEGKPYWKVWRVGIDPVAWRGTQTGGGPSGLRVCPGALVGFSFGVGTPQRPNEMSVTPERVVTTPGWLPPAC